MCNQCQTATTTHTPEALLAALVRRSARSPFAASLARQFAGGLSPNQTAWAVRFADEDALAAQPAATVGGLAPIVSLLASAKASGLKKPGIVFRDVLEGSTIAVRFAPDHGRNPGNVYVTLNGEYAGRIDPAGCLHAARQHLAESLLTFLEQFAVDPAEFSAAYGRRTGRCCFCDALLTDPTSLALGYGPVCAKRHGMEHGAKAARKLAAAV